MEKELKMKKIAKNYLGFPPKSKKQKITYTLLLLLILLLPYKNTAGGLITIISEGEQRLQSPFNGEIKFVNDNDFNKKIKEGTILAKIVSDEVETSLRELTEEVAEQESKILTIESEIEINNRQLNKYRDLYRISSERYGREYKLYLEGGISLNKLAEIERQMSTDRSNIETQQIIVEKTKQQVVTAESELAQLIERMKYYDKQVGKSEIRMPFDGYIYSKNLKSRIGSQVKEGDNIASASKILKSYGLIRVSENVSGGIELNDKVEIRLGINPLRTYKGKVIQIDRAVIANESKGQTSKNVDSGNDVKIVKETTGKVIEVRVEFDDKDNLDLVPGLTGWGKISRGYVPLGWAYSQSIIRFMQIEVWSWVP